MGKRTNDGAGGRKVSSCYLISCGMTTPLDKDKVTQRALESAEGSSLSCMYVVCCTTTMYIFAET